LDDGAYIMKPFFGVLLLASIVFPFISFFTTMRDFAHNQWEMRHERLVGTTSMTATSAHLGLTAAQLTGLDNLVADACKDSVYDGYRLGGGYSKLWLQSLGLDALLFVASLVGLSACRRSDRPTNRSSRTAAQRSD
jgi:hypothetical protein